MAFFGKAGSILRQVVSNKQISREISASSPSIFQTIRWMSSNKVFIGGVSYQTSEDGLRQAFDKYGSVVDARIVVDRESGRSRGFGFVTYSSIEEAASAIQAWDGKELDGRIINVNYANERMRSPGFSSSGYRSDYGGGNNSGFGGDNYNSGGNSYNGGGNNYNSGWGDNNGSGVGYGTGGGTDGGYAGGSNVDYGTERQSLGGGGGENFANGSNNFAATSGYDGNTNFGNEFGNFESSNIGGGGEGYSQAGPLEGNFRDAAAEPEDFAGRA